MLYIFDNLRSDVLYFRKDAKKYSLKERTTDCRLHLKQVPVFRRVDSTIERITVASTNSVTRRIRYSPLTARR